MNIQDLTALMDDIRQKKAAIKFDLKQIEEEEKKVETALKGHLKELNVDTIDIGVYNFGFKETKRKAFDQKLFGEKHPDLLEQFKVEKVTQKFEFKINSGKE